MPLDVRLVENEGVEGHVENEEEDEAEENEEGEGKDPPVLRPPLFAEASPTHGLCPHPHPRGVAKISRNAGSIREAPMIGAWAKLLNKLPVKSLSNHPHRCTPRLAYVKALRRVVGATPATKPTGRAGQAGPGRLEGSQHDTQKPEHTDRLGMGVNAEGKKLLRRMPLRTRRRPAA